MSEMTATRIVVAATLAAAWLAAAAVLWQTEVPDGLAAPDVDAAAVFGSERVADNAHYAQLLRVLLVLSLAAQLAVLALTARHRRALGRGLVGPPLMRAALLGAGVVGALWVVRVPFAVVRHWWRRRHDVSDLDYASYLVGGWPWLIGQVVVAGR